MSLIRVRHGLFPALDFSSTGLFLCAWHRGLGRGLVCWTAKAHVR